MKFICAVLARVLGTTWLVAAGIAMADGFQVQVFTPAPAGMPEHISGDLISAVGGSRYLSVTGPQGPCLTQFATNTAEVFTLAWQSQGRGTYKITSQKQSDGTEWQPIAQTNNQIIRINNGVFVTAHDPLRSGGLPAQVTIGTAPAPIQLNYADRVSFRSWTVFPGRQSAGRGEVDCQWQTVRNRRSKQRILSD